MFPNLHINKKSSVPAYRQIIENMTALIHREKLKPGDRLPSERELAQELGIARGTIKKAYEGLCRSHIIEVIQGRGTFVSSRQNVVVGNRKERAMRLIDALLVDLEKLKFSHREISSLIDLKILEREERMASFTIAAVDCNPESLAIYERQLGFLSRVRIVPFLLDDLLQSPNPAEKLGPFEVVLTTSTHYSELIGMVPGLQEKILQVVVSPGQQSIISLAKLTSQQKIGVVCESKKFLNIIRTKLREFQIPSGNVSNLFLADEEKLPAFLEGKDAVIVPPAYSIQRKKANLAAVQAFRQRGGQLIKFDFQIERGSLLYVEERIKGLLQK